MDRVPTDKNTAALHRLTTLVDALNDEGLATLVEAGWTVSAVLAQLAFWDRWALTLVHHWRSGQLPPPTMPAWYDEAIDAALLPTWQALPGAEAAKLALNAATSVDIEIGKAETPVVSAILAVGQDNLLNRHLPRNHAVDRIEAARAR